MELSVRSADNPKHMQQQNFEVAFEVQFSKWLLSILCCLIRLNSRLEIRFQMQPQILLHYICLELSELQTDNSDIWFLTSINGL